MLGRDGGDEVVEVGRVRDVLLSVVQRTAVLGEDAGDGLGPLRVGGRGAVEGVDWVGCVSVWLMIGVAMSVRYLFRLLRLGLRPL